MSNKDAVICLNCGRSEMEVPVVVIRYAGNSGHVCSQCMPVFIHKPEQFADKLKDIDAG